MTPRLMFDPFTEKMKTHLKPLSISTIVEEQKMKKKS